jgi:hypothetical protein
MLPSVIGSIGSPKRAISAADLHRGDLEDCVPDVERLHQRDLGFHPFAAVNAHVDGLILDGTRAEASRGPPAAFPNGSGSRVTLTAIRRASSFVSIFARRASASLPRE